MEQVGLVWRVLVAWTTGSTRTLILSLLAVISACGDEPAHPTEDAAVDGHSGDDASLPEPPSALAYSSNPAVYAKGAAIAANTPSSQGGPVASYAVTPNLPAGLALDVTTGVISGTPTAIAPAADFTVTAMNAGGSDTATLSIAIVDAAPADLTYSANPATYTKDAAISPNMPSSAGGTVLSYAVAPSLPAGLSLDTSTGVISGTPTSITSTASYTVTATNGAGSTQTAVTITITDAAPSSLAYSTNPATYTKGQAITANSPSSSGGVVVSYAVSPSLPAGLSLSTTTGVITGTPTAITASASYIVTATNTGGSTQASLTITVNDAAPSSLAYSTNPATYTKGQAIATNSPSSSGGAVVSYAVSPSLPTGLSLSVTTGVITGTPAAITGSASYIVTATNTGGSTQASLTITVNDAAPSSLAYSTNPATYTKGQAIITNSPSSSGGAVVSYAVSPSLPAGLSLSTTTGVITGTPTAITASTSYIVTATNTGGSTQASLTITVNDAAPSSLAYSTNPATYTKGQAITTNSPSSAGGTVVSYAVSPSLPTGLSLSTTTGVITGTPTAITASASYTVTATNTGGSTQASLTITVNDAAPSSLAYSTNPATYTKGQAIATNSPSSSGGAVISYAVSPSLPTGLSLSTTTGVITGTPTAITASASYIVTATNTGGSTQASLTITVDCGSGLLAIGGRCYDAACGSALLVPRDFSTLSNAISAASPGATICVSEGTYAGGVAVQKQLQIIGAGAGRTEITASSGAVVSISPSGLGTSAPATVRGFKITCNGADRGVLITKGHQINVEQNEISCPLGIQSVALDQTSLTIEVTIARNRIFSSNYGVIVETGAFNSTALRYPVAIQSNLIVVGAGAAAGFAIQVQDYGSFPAGTEAHIDGNTLIGNGTASGVDISDSANARGITSVFGNVIHGFTVAVSKACTSCTATVQDNVLWANTSSYIGVVGADINDDPLFVAPLTGDFHLQPGSPCVDAGTFSIAVPFDLDGTSRPNGSAVDIGAYEWH